MTDEELLLEIKRGSQAALDSLIRRHYYDVYAFIMRRTHDQQLSYDLTQDVFAKVLKSIYQFRHESSVQSWLFTIAINQTRDFYRSKQGKTLKLQQEFEDGWAGTSTENLHYLYEMKEASVEMKQAISQLPDYQAEPILLKYYHDLKTREIAAISQVSENTIKSRIYQGLQKLERILRKEKEHESGRVNKNGKA